MKNLNLVVILVELVCVLGILIFGLGIVELPTIECWEDSSCVVSMVLDFAPHKQ